MNTINFLHLSLAESDGTNIAPLLVSVLVIGLLFFLMIVRPQKKNISRHQEMVASLKVGDEVITSGGLYGTIVSVDDDSIQLLVAAGVTVRIALRSVALKKAPNDDGDNTPEAEEKKSEKE